MIILRLLLLLTNLHLKLLSTQGTGADKLLSTQRVKGSFPKIMFLFFVQKSRWPYSMQNTFGMDKIQESHCNESVFW